jgi:peptide/nickel transport system permease protein
MGMGKYILQRLAFTVLVVIGISILVFFLTHVVGNPVDLMLPLQATDEQRIALTQQLGLDKPILEQLGIFLSDIARLDFGMSWWQRRPCIDVIMDDLPLTAFLILLASIISIIVAIPLGIFAAYKPGTMMDRVLTIFSTMGICLPPFWIGLMLMLVFAVRLGWFPTSGIGTWKHLILPAVTIAFRPMGHLAQIVRFEMMQQLNGLYVITARAKGVAERTVLFKHALKNIMTSSITMIGSDYAKQIGGLSAAVEVVFGFPGFGHLISETIENMDFPLLQAEVFFVAIIICLINLLVDILYAAVDPRIRY